MKLDITDQAKHNIQWEKVDIYLRSHFPEEMDSPLLIKQFSSGYSNLTFFIQLGKLEMVMRRPPFGKIPPRSHDMKREFDILKKIHPVFPLAPQPLLYADDPHLMDKHFFIMEKKQGIVLDDNIPPSIENIPFMQEKISNTVVDTLVKLHDININENGIKDLGKPEGFLKRQVEGWSKRYFHSTDEPHPLAEEIIEWLQSNLPSSPPAAIVHNDLKLNNMMLDSNNPAVVNGVFDWELCTVGDPLTDLATSVAYWTEPNDKETGLTSVTRREGFMTRREFIEKYALASGRNVDNIDYYLTFSFFKIAVILQQIYYRWRQGEIEDSRFSRLNTGINNLIEQSHLASRKVLL